MSARGLGAPSVSASNYPTPASLTRRLFEVIGETLGPFVGTTIWDPCAGDGALLREARRCAPGAVLRATELREECRRPLWELCGDGAVTIGDALQAEVPDADHRPSLIITNPPFELMDAIVERFVPATRHGRHVLILLCRVSWWCGAESHAELLERVGMPDILGVPERVSFVTVRWVDEDGRRLAQGGNDSVGVAWHVWSRSTQPPPPAGLHYLLRKRHAEERVPAPIRTLVVRRADFEAHGKAAEVIEERWTTTETTERSETP